LNPVEGSFLFFYFVWWSAFAALGDGLKCFLLLRSLWVFAQVVGFHLNDCIEYFTFQSIPLLINSINLKRDGVRICLGKDVGM
jgi:hypothetical protein